MKHGQILKNGKEIAQVVHDGDFIYAAIFEIDSLRLSRTTQDVSGLLKQNFKPINASLILTP